MKAILLLRVSTEDQDFEHQRAPLMDYLAKHPELEYSDDRVFAFEESGYKDVSRRKKFNKLLESIPDNEQYALICHKVDRLGRDFLSLTQKISEFIDSRRLELHFVGEGLVLRHDTDAGRKFTFSLLCGLAQYYSDAISDNVIRGLRSIFMKGRIISKAPYGYKSIPTGKEVDGKLEKVVKVNDLEREIVIKIFHLYIHEGLSLKAISKEIYDEYNEIVKKDKIHRILRNRFYYGINTYKKYGLEIPHIYETFITKSTYLQAQKMLKAKNNGAGTRKSKDVRIFQKILKCKYCSATCSPESKRGKLRYGCSFYKGRHDIKGTRSKNEDELLKLIAKELSSIKVPQEILKKSNKFLEEIYKQETKSHSNTLSNFDKKLEEIDDYRRKLLKSSNLTQEFINEELSNLLKEEQDIKDKIESTNSRLPEVIKEFQDAISLLSNIDLIFKSSKKEDKRLILKNLFSNIFWDGENLITELNSPYLQVKSLKDVSYGAGDAIRTRDLFVGNEML